MIATSHAGRDWNYRDSYAGNYMDGGQRGWRTPDAGYYDFAPGGYDSDGPGYYYDRDLAGCAGRSAEFRAGHGSLCCNVFLRCCAVVSTFGSAEI